MKTYYEIGEIFEVRNDKIKTVEVIKEKYKCSSCYFYNCNCVMNCHAKTRKDKKFVNFVKIENVVENNKGEFSDKYYNFKYKLSEKDIETGFIKIDPYFITKEWKLNSKDDTGILFHCLKTLCRFGEKNSIGREIKALNAQIKRLAEINKIEL